MKDIVIYGASGFGTQMAFAVECINAALAGPAWNILGYLDDDPSKHGNEPYGYRVLGGEDWLERRESQVAVVIGAGYPDVKARVAEKLSRWTAVTLPTLVHPSAIVCRTTKIGYGTVVCENVVIKTNVRIGDLVTINTGVIVGHDASLEHGVSLMPGVNISGETVIGARTFIGSNATVLQGLRVGGGSVIGAGAVVTKDIPEKCTAVGVPAKIIKTDS